MTKVKKMLEVELHEAAKRIAEKWSKMVALGVSKRKLEAEHVELRSELKEAMAEAKGLEERVGKVSADVARLAEELKAEQERSCCLERERKMLEHQGRDLQRRVEEVEVGALKEGRRIMQKKEERVSC
jgi:myosin protein heavy chain